MFKLARGLWDCKNSINHIMAYWVGTLVKSEANEV